MSATIMDKDQIFRFWLLIYLIDFMYIDIELLYNIHGHCVLRKASLNLHFVLIYKIKTVKICEDTSMVVDPEFVLLIEYV